MVAREGRESGAFETFEATSPNRGEAVTQTRKAGNGMEGVWVVAPLRSGLTTPLNFPHHEAPGRRAGSSM